MTDLTEKALEDIGMEIANIMRDKGEMIGYYPTKIFIPRYPGEPLQEYFERLDRIQRVMESFHDSSS